MAISHAEFEYLLKHLPPELIQSRRVLTQMSSSNSSTPIVVKREPGADAPVPPDSAYALSNGPQPNRDVLGCLWNFHEYAQNQRIGVNKPMTILETVQKLAELENGKVLAELCRMLFVHYPAPKAAQDESKK